jgi:ABC-type transport system involved in cytochrome c biogenesis permease subunit
VQTGVTATPTAHPAQEAGPEPERKPVSLPMRALKALASLRLTVVLFVLSFILVFYGTVAQIDNGIGTVVDQYFRSFIVFIPVRLNFQVLAVFLGIPVLKVPGSIPFPAGYTLGFLLLGNLLAAHALRFKLSWARGGVLLLHAGLILLLLGELATGLVSQEGEMILGNGESADFVFDGRKCELAIINSEDPKQDDVVVIPGALLARNKWANVPAIANPDLPFQIKVERWMTNSALAMGPPPGGQNPANAGVGLGRHAVERPEVNGVDPNQKMDLPSAYVTLGGKDQKPLGTYLVSLHVSEPQTVVVDGKKYDIVLRFKHIYEPYRVHLIKFIHKRFPGGDKPREFSSLIELEYPKGSEKREVLITMNSPLRLIVGWEFFGLVPRVHTFFQSSFLEQDAGTILHVVDNRSWLMPYISCTLVAIGMLWHFLIVLVTALRRTSPKSTLATPLAAGGPSWLRWAMPVGIGVPLLWFLYCALPVTDSAEGLHIQAFGRLPVQTGGRVMPLDTLARNTLLVLGTRETYYEEKLAPGEAAKANEEDKVWVRRPAIKWLLDVLTAHYEAEAEPMIKVEDDVAAVLGLPRGGMFAFNDLRPVLGRLAAEVEKIQAKKLEQITDVDRNIFRLARMIERFRRAAHITSFRVFRIENEEVQALLGLKRREGMRYGIDEFVTRLPNLEAAAQTAYSVRKNTPNLVTAFQANAIRVYEAVGMYMALAEMNNPQSPRLLPPFSDPSDEHWTLWNPDTLPPGGESAQRAATNWRKMLASYYVATRGPERERPDAIVAFNKAVADYQQLLDQTAIPGTSSVGLEQHYNSMSPFYQVLLFYILATLLSLVGLVCLFAGEKARTVGQGLMQVAFWMAVVTVTVHTVALIMRMYLQGRPPVTNLYSSAIFIGWGCVLLGLALDSLYRTGLGTLAGCALGAITGVVGVFLASSGDTMEMMQAVLDTNFWLATHVVCITLGYTTTLLAGFLGIASILFWLMEELTGSRQLFKDERRLLNGMTYGVVCFATLLSFVGTVLGGIWADQSWGRFWGWDPKENGAILIVIWNALILHARWAGMVKPLGVAALAVAGNMVVVWSWFGTNQLGVGLHAYGFSNTLAMFCDFMWGTHLAVLALLWVPSLLKLYGWTPPTAAAKSA